jgi:DNA-binding CsgD family transcriptional regulator
MIFAREKIDELVVHCRLAEAATALALARAENSRSQTELRSALAGVYALSGDDRGLARVIDPWLLACRNGAAVNEYYATIAAERGVADHLSAGAVLAWSGDAAGVYDSLRAAHDLALSERRFHLAVAARERLAHHALLFGDVKIARAAIDEATGLARLNRLSAWGVRCLAAAARLALDAGDLDRAAQLIERGKAESHAGEARALFAPSGAQLAIELRDEDALRAWSSQGNLETALHSQVPEAAIAATIAALIGAGAPAAGSPAATALRRALLQADGAANSPELFSMAARFGDLEEARLGVGALTGAVAPDRAYLKAHYMLARAHQLARAGETKGWIDCAGDAARAFNSMGLRRWTNDAMLLLVAQEPVAQRRKRGRPSGALLTGREQQVAHLIRSGARNREVALALQISEHTVERHVSSILGRLGLRSRWQIADPRKSGEH